MNKKYMALVGLGYWGKNILRNLCELGILHTACDPNVQTIIERKQQFPDINYTDSFEEIIQNDDIEAIVISSPADTHYSLAMQSLLAGKDVFVEKPLALTVREGEELVAVAETRKRVMMVGHILQYHPAIMKLRELISGGELGKVQYIYSNRLNIGKLRTEENILWSFAPHDISVILMLLGEEPVKVSAVGGDYLNKGIFDTTLTTLEFRNGVKGHIFVSWLHPYKEQKLIVVGSKAMAVFDDVSNEKLFLYHHKISWKDGKIPVAHKADYEVVPIAEGEPLKLELMHFVECVEKRNVPLTDGREGLKVLGVLEAAEKSMCDSLRRQSFKVERTAKTGFADVSGAFIHPTAVIDEGVEVAAGTNIWHFAHILRGSRIGKNCVIGQNAAIGPDVRIGDGCKIQNNVSIYKGVALEEDVFCGPSCVFTNVYTPRAFVDRKGEFLPTLVRRGATIGANATVVCGTTIGRYAMVGAGAVVKADVPDYAVVAGVPALQTGWACRCGMVLKFVTDHALCSRCGNEYALDAGKFSVVKEDSD